METRKSYLFKKCVISNRPSLSVYTYLLLAFNVYLILPMTGSFGHVGTHYSLYALTAEEMTLDVRISHSSPENYEDEIQTT